MLCTGLRHVVAFDLALGDEEGIIKVIEIEPHSHRPNSAKIEHIVPFTSAKTCYQDILKVKGWTSVVDDATIHASVEMLSHR